MALAISNAEIESVCDMRLCVEALDDAYAQISAGTAVNSPRIDVLTPRPDVVIGGRAAPSYHLLKTMSAATPRFACVRILTDRLAWPVVDAAPRRRRLNPSRAYSVTRGLLLLFDVLSGDPLALLAEGWIRNMRVGASAALAARRLARPDCASIGVLGTGFMARSNLEAIAMMRPGCRVRVFSPTREHRETFAAEMGRRLQLQVTPAPSAHDAVEAADLVIAATNSLRPVVAADLLEPGMHLTCVRHCEFDEAVYRRCDRVFLNLKSHSAPECLIARREDGRPTPDCIGLDYGEGHPSTDGPFWSAVPDLVDLFSGRAAGRTDAAEITCFDNSAGWGLQFAAVAGRVYEIAASRGLGQEIPDALLPGLFGG